MGGVNIGGVAAPLASYEVPYIGTYFDVGTGFNFNYLGGLSYEPGQDPSGPLITPTANFVENPWLSPDGTMWTFMNAGKIYVLNTDGTGLTLVYDGTNGGVEFSLWGPDSTFLIFTPRDYLTDGADIFTAPADGSNTSGSILATIAGAKPVAEPQYSDDGTKILFARNNTSTQNQVWVMEADGSSPTQIATFPTQFSGLFGERPALTFQPGTTRFTWNDGSLASPVWKCMGIDGSGIVTLNSGTSSTALTPRFRSWLPDASGYISRISSAPTVLKLVQADGSGNATWFTTAHSITANYFVMPNDLTRVYYDSGNDIYSFLIDPVGTDERNELPSGDGTGTNFGLTG